MKYRAVSDMKLASANHEGSPAPACPMDAEFPNMHYEALSDAEFEYQELLAEEDFSLERFKYSLLLTLMLWLVLFAAWGVTRLIL